MPQVILRNRLVVLGVGLPTLITCAAVVTWLVPPAWADGARPAPSATGFAGGFAFWYLVTRAPRVARPSDRSPR